MELSHISPDPIKFRLLSVEAVLTILKLANSIYPPGSWQYHALKPENGADALIESWTLRSGISNWAWRAVTELRDVTDECMHAFVHRVPQNAKPVTHSPFEDAARDPLRADANAHCIHTISH